MCGDKYNYFNITLSPPVKYVLLTVPRRCFFSGSFLLFMFRVCHAFLSVHCCLVVTCWERDYLLALLYMMFSTFLSLSHDVLGQVWYLIISIPDLCLLTYFACRALVNFYMYIEHEVTSLFRMSKSLQDII